MVGRYVIVGQPWTVHHNLVEVEAQLIADYLLGDMSVSDFNKIYLNKKHILLRGASDLPSFWGMKELDVYLNSHEGQLHGFVQGAKDGAAIDIPVFSGRQGGSQKNFIEKTFTEGATFKISDLEWRSSLFSSLCTQVYVADSFEGLPPPGRKDSIMDHEIWYKFKNEAPEYYLDCRYSIEDVRRNFSAYDLLDQQVIFLKGWFDQTLSSLGDVVFSLVRIDADWHDSCRCVLDNVYSRLANGGYVIVDDYNLQGCRSAIDEFRIEHSINDRIEIADAQSGIIYWRKS